MDRINIIRCDYIPAGTILVGPDLYESIKRNYGEGGSNLTFHEYSVVKTTCTKPPAGRHCTREAGHDGPCAAVPLMRHSDDTPQGSYV